MSSQDTRTFYDLFWSYRHLDAPRVRPLVDALRARDLKIWIDEREIQDFAGITRSIVEGLARAKALVAYYSAQYPRSRACQWELTAAFLAAQRQGDPRRRVLVINPEPQPAHIHPVELKDALFQGAPTPGDTASIDRLVGVIADHAAGLDGTLGELGTLVAPQWYGNRGVGSNHFVGRLTDLWRIHSGLHAADVPVITQTVGPAVVQLTGLGGTGKSLLAEEYALRFGGAFPGGVFWLRAFGHDDAREGLTAEQREAERSRQMLEFAVALDLPVRDQSPEVIEAQLARELGRRERPFLWVVDDLPHGLEVDALKRRWLAPHPLGRTLITTRSREYRALGTVAPLGVLDRGDAYQLLTSRRSPTGPEEEASAHGLVGDMGGHALAVEVAASALEAYAGLRSFTQFRAALANPAQDELELAQELTGALPTGHEKSVASTLLGSVKLLDPDATEFMRLASLLAVAPVPAALVASVLRIADGLDAETAQRRAARAIHGADQIGLTERGDGQAGAPSVHALVSRTMRFHDRDAARRERVQAAAIQALTDDLSTLVEARAHLPLAPLIPHARSLVTRVETSGAAALMGWVGRHDYLRGAYRLAIHAYRRQHELTEALLGPEHPDTLGARRDLGVALLAQGDYAAARPLQETNLALATRIFGPEHRETIAAMRNLALTFYSLGEPAHARPLQEQDLEISRRVFGAEDPFTLDAMHNLALTCRLQGDLASSRALDEQVLSARRRVLGPEHPDTFKSMNNLAAMLKKQGDWRRASELLEEALTIETRVLGEEHPDTLLSMGNLAAVLAAQGDSVSARSLQEKQLAISSRVLGEDHPDTWMTMNNLAGTLMAEGRIAESRDLHERTLARRQRILGEDHPDTLQSKLNLGLALNRLGEASEARALFEAALDSVRRILGEESELALFAMCALAATLAGQGDLAAARTLYERALEIHRRTLGEDHPDTLGSMHNLAWVLEKQGDLAGARAQYEETLARGRRVLGKAHPQTLSMMGNLALICRSQGDLAQARRLYEELLATRRSALGREHPDTTLAAWKLCFTLQELRDSAGACAVIEQDLAWLLERAPDSLTKDQRTIRDCAAEAKRTMTRWGWLRALFR